jgi:glutathione S-transferase
MADYELYYWPIPFRGQFVRALLAFAGKSWKEGDIAAMTRMKNGATSDMTVPFMGPPVLIDKRANFAVSQMPAIVLYLGETLKLMPADPALKAMTLKIVCDANDVIDDITLDGGRLMWTPARWKDFTPRLKRWMSFWDEIGRRHGLSSDAGYLLGGDEPGVADVVTATLWSTMADRFPVFGEMLEEAAPMTAALTRRVAALPALAKLAADTKAAYGEVYCGGQIEASLRRVLGA